jgi:Thioredoxin like C-terminal domain
MDPGLSAFVRSLSPLAAVGRQTQADSSRSHFRTKRDGKEPGANHGVDIDAQGNGTIREHRLYQLIRQQGTIDDRTVEIEFLDSGVQAFAFTFG